MSTLLKGIIRKINKTKMIGLEEDLNQLKENILYGQQLLKIGSWTYDIQKGKAFWTEGIYHILEASFQDLDSKLDDFYSYVHPDDLGEVVGAVNGALEGKEYDIEYRIVTPSKKVKYIIEKAVILLDENNKPIKIIGTIQDITKQKLVENNYKILGDNLNKAQRVAGVGSWKYDAINDELFFSEEVHKILGIDMLDDKKDYNSFLELVHHDDQTKIKTAIDSCLTGKAYEIDHRILQFDGTERFVTSKGEPLFDEEQQIVGIIGTIQDITEKKILQEKIDKTNRKFEALIQDSNDVFVIIDYEGIIQYISPAVKNTLGYSVEERIGKKAFDMVEEKERLKFTKMMELVLNYPDKKITGDMVAKTKDGKEIFVEVNLSNQLSEPSIQGIVINFRDITKRIKMEEEIRYIATHDNLTKLPNSIYFNEQIKLQCKESKEKENTFAVFKLDIDGFKGINDTLGYKLGDEFIIQISRRLKELLGDTGSIYRWFGNKFTIIVPGLNTIEEYESVAKDIIGLFLQPFSIDKYELYFTINIGISIYPEDALDPDSILSQANTALLRSKDEGKNKYLFHSTNMSINNYKRFMLQNDLYKAIEENQLRVYYQPLINIKTNEILGAEALIRWEHPIWGMVSPDEFIYLAEESGFIINIGNWILREVCHNYKEWLDDGLPTIKVSINYSSIQFSEKDLVKNMKSIINEFELDPHFLIVEITENILLKNSERVISCVKDLQALGIQIALDDFGTGYSSLASLNTFRVDILKIDRSFIKNIPSDVTNTKIINSIIYLAKELRIKIVAEGIENWEELSYLRKLNCYTGQGFLYSKPIPKQDFERILAKKKCKPIRANDARIIPSEERRKYFRVDFTQLLEADMTIMEIGGEKSNVGSTTVVIKNIGPGGLCFISNINLPIKRDIILKFTSQLMEKEVMVYGCPIWKEEFDNNLFEYGIEFTIDENERTEITGILNQVQVRFRNNTKFADGRFISVSPVRYFNSEEMDSE